MMKPTKYYFIFGEGSKINQLICAILINIPVFMYGASIGWMSPMTLLLQSDHSPRGTPLTDIEVSWMGSVGYMVCIPADFLLAYLGDKIGRKKTLLLLSLISAVCWTIKLSSMDPWAFILARVLVGFSMACYVTCPVYTKEISEDSVRGLFCSFVILGHTSGNLFLYIIGDLLDYHTVLWICLALPAVHLVLFLMMPESPSYLVKKGQFEEATRIMAWLRCRKVDDPVVKREIETIKKEQINAEDSSKFVLKYVLKDKILFRAFRIAIVVALAREVCGTIPVLNYAGEIFTDASKGTNLVLTPNQQAMMLGAVQVAGSMLGTSIMEQMGRKFLFMVTSLVSGMSMCALASWFVARDFALWTPGWIPITTLCLCVFCDSSGLQPVSVVITGEIFSFEHRGTIVAVTMACASSIAFLQMLVFKPLVKQVGIYACFYFFGVVCVGAAFYALLVIPETKQKTLEEIHEKLKTKKERARERENEKCVSDKTEMNMNNS